MGSRSRAATKGGRLERLGWVIACLVVAAAAPRTSAAQPEPPPTLTESDCPALFGDASQRAANRDRRAGAVRAVWRLDGSAAVLHTRQWRDAEPLRVEGVEVIGRDSSNEEPRVLLRLGEELASLQCEPGLYSIGVDAALGEGAYVLSITPRLVLVQWHGELRYLISREDQLTDVQVIWGSPWRVPRPVEPYRGSTTRSRRSRRRYRSSRRRRRRR